MLYRFGIVRMFPAVKVIHILREDLLSQAVSMSIATQTKQWTSKLASQGEAVFRPDEIFGIVETIAMSNISVQLYCAAMNIPRIRVIYEDLVNTPERELRRVFEFVDLDPAMAIVSTPSIQKQADATNAAFVEKTIKLLLKVPPAANSQSGMTAQAVSSTRSDNGQHPEKSKRWKFWRSQKDSNPQPAD